MIFMCFRLFLKIIQCLKANFKLLNLKRRVSWQLILRICYNSGCQNVCLILILIFQIEKIDDPLSFGLGSKIGKRKGRGSQNVYSCNISWIYLVYFVHNKFFIFQIEKIDDPLSFGWGSKLSHERGQGYQGYVL